MNHTLRWLSLPLAAGVSAYARVWLLRPVQRVIEISCSDYESATDFFAREFEFVALDCTGDWYDEAIAFVRVIFLLLAVGSAGFVAYSVAPTAKRLTGEVCAILALAVISGYYLMPFVPD